MPPCICSLLKPTCSHPALETPSAFPVTPLCPLGLRADQETPGAWGLIGGTSASPVGIGLTGLWTTPKERKVFVWFADVDEKSQSGSKGGGLQPQLPGPFGPRAPGPGLQEHFPNARLHITLLGSPPSAPQTPSGSCCVRTGVLVLSTLTSPSPSSSFGPQTLQPLCTAGPHAVSSHGAGGGCSENFP